MSDERQKKIEDFVNALAKKCQDRFGCRAEVYSTQLIGLNFDDKQKAESIADFLKEEIDKFEITPYAEMKPDDALCLEGKSEPDGVRVTMRHTYSICFYWDDKKLH